MATPTKTFTTEDLLNKPFSAEEFPGLEAMALETYEIPFSELTEHLQADIRERVKRMHAGETLRSLRQLLFFVEEMIPVEKERPALCGMARQVITKAEGR